MSDPVSAAARRFAPIRERMEYEITMATFVITAHPDCDVEAVLRDVVESALKQAEAALASDLSRPPCTHPAADQEYKIHLREFVCRCGARRFDDPGSRWYRYEGAIDHRR